jgi:sugar/nucleoside kinase (ribokinase family)
MMAIGTNRTEWPSQAWATISFPTDLSDRYERATALLVNSMNPLHQRHWVGHAKARRMLIAMTTNSLYLADPTLCHTVVQLLPELDLFICNRRESSILSGGYYGDDALKALADLCACPIITNGGDDVCFTSGGALERMRVPRVVIKDPTGAGDVFAGTLLASLSKAKSLEESVEAALRLAALSVTAVGPRALLNAGENRGQFSQVSKPEL